MESNSPEQDDWEPYQPEHDEVFVANVTRGADEVETCSISPLPGNEQALLCEWIAAREGSFVSLDTMR